MVATRCYVVSGCPDPIELTKSEADRHPELLVQGVRGGAASNEFLVEMLAAQTLKASETGNLLADRREIDLLLRLAGTNQIVRAIEKLGARRGEPLLIIVAGDETAVAAYRARPPWKRLRRKGLSDSDKRRIERAALLNAL